MVKRITIIDGHPDSQKDRLCHALVAAYLEGAVSAGHTVRTIAISSLQYPLIASPTEYRNGAVPEDIINAQQEIEWAEHIVIVYPLWLGTMPALLKGFLEQILRPGFAFVDQKGGFPKGRLLGRSARIVVTMGMPAFVYRWYFFAHGLKALERNILKFCGLAPVRNTIFGMVEATGENERKLWLQKMKQLGKGGQ